MAAETSRSGASADSYIGSLISLTSKSEIRYEGILYSINTEESSIGLRNVRSFGTEGRKKDGPQIPPSDKIYEYILFRGTDIKTHYPHPVSTSTSLPTAGSGGTTTDVTSHSAQLGLPRPTFQGGLPPYQPSGGLGTWGSSPAPPTANGSGLGMPPMYWQGYYAPSSGLPQLQQTTLLRPPPGLPLPHSMQHPFQYPGINPSLPSGAQSFPELPPLFPQTNSNPALTSSPLPLTLDLSSTSSLSMETSSTLLQNKAPVTTIAASAFGTSLPLASLSISNFEKVIPPTTPAFSSNPIIGHGSTLPYLSISQPEPPTTVSSSSSQVEKAVALVTPDKLLPLVTTVLPSSQPLQTGKIDADVKVGDEKAKLSLSEPTLGAPAETKEPILPLPKSNLHKPRHVTKFTEDFDFTAMNEKFNKDEVWGNLGKNKTHLKDNDGVFQEDETYDTLEEDDDTLNKITSKPVYVKDDFFDTLSCTTLDRGTRGGRTRFSEQLKIDTETFGDFTRLRPGRSGGRGFRGGGRRGSYYGGGYGYNRGRGYGYSHRAS
ncbi:hypothetical protein ZIOFF_020679 [Zingiber officinale]|uniref:Protein decapping 5 n=1 Tax=Zingiber officinale TaxID=94328 RepID=A0A8J5LLH8_ZINOF|nr:hypothetical protein ZIOFF_020679 [Zingiber officinale]